MAPYLTIYLALVLLSVAGRTWRAQQAILAGVILFLIVFVGARLNTGCDFTGYLSRFQNLVTDINEPVIFLEEPGYYLLTSAIKNAGLDYFWVNFSAAIIFFFLIWRYSKTHPRPLWFIALTFPILIVQLAMSGIRQALAVAFLTGAYSAFCNDKRLIVAAYILAAGSFHTSALIFLPLALMVGRTYSTPRILGALLLLLPVASLLMQDRLEVYQQRYIEAGDSMYSSGAFFRVALIIISATLFELHKKYYSHFFPGQFNLMRIFSLASFMLVPAYLLNTVMAHRLAYYILPVQLYMLAAFPLIFASGDLRRLRIAYGGIMATYGAYIVVWFLASSHAQICYIPYDSYLFH